MNLLSLYVKFRVNVMTLKLRWHPYCQFSTDSPSVTNVSLPKNVYRAHLQTTLTEILKPIQLIIVTPSSKKGLLQVYKMVTGQYLAIIE